MMGTMESSLNLRLLNTYNSHFKSIEDMAVILAKSGILIDTLLAPPPSTVALTIEPAFKLVFELSNAQAE